MSGFYDAGGEDESARRDAASENPLQSGQISLFSGASIRSFIFDYFKEHFAQAKLDTPRSYMQYIWNLGADQTETLKQNIAEKIGQLINSGEMKPIPPSTSEDDNTTHYNIGEATLAQTTRDDGTFEFTPIGKFTGILRVQRVDDDGNLIPNSVDIIEYIDGKPELVIPGTVGKTRVAGFGNIEREVEIVLADQPPATVQAQQTDLPSVHSTIPPSVKQPAQVRDMPIPANPSLTAPIFPTQMETENIRVAQKSMKRGRDDDQEEEQNPKRRRVDNLEGIKLPGPPQRPQPITQVVPSAQETKSLNYKEEPQEVELTGISSTAPTAKTIQAERAVTPHTEEKPTEIKESGVEPNYSGVKNLFKESKPSNEVDYNVADLFEQPVATAVVAPEVPSKKLQAAAEVLKPKKGKSKKSQDDLQVAQATEKARKEKAEEAEKKQNAGNDRAKAQKEKDKERRIAEQNRLKLKKQSKAEKDRLDAEKAVLAQRKADQDARKAEAEATRRKMEAEEAEVKAKKAKEFAESLKKQKFPGPPPRKVEGAIIQNVKAVGAPQAKVAEKESQLQATKVNSPEIPLTTAKRVKLQEVQEQDDRSTVIKGQLNDDTETIVPGTVIQNESGGRISAPVLDKNDFITQWAQGVPYVQAPEDPSYTQDYPDDLEENLYHDIDALDPESQDIRDTGTVLYGTNEVVIDNDSDAEIVIHQKPVEMSVEDHSKKKEEEEAEAIKLKDMAANKVASAAVANALKGGVGEIAAEKARLAAEEADRKQREADDARLKEEQAKALALRSGNLEKEIKSARMNLEAVMQGRSNIEKEIQELESFGIKRTVDSKNILKKWDDNVSKAQVKLDEVLERQKESNKSSVQSKDTKLPGHPPRQKTNIPQNPIVVEMPELKESQEQEMRAERSTIAKLNTLEATKVQKTTKEDMGWQFQEGPMADEVDESSVSESQNDQLGIQEGEDVQKVEESPVKQEELKIQEAEHEEEAVTEDTKNSISEIPSKEEEERLAFELSMKLRGERINMISALNDGQAKLETLYNNWIEESANKNFSQENQKQFDSALKDLKEKQVAYNEFYNKHEKQLSEAEKLAKAKGVSEKLPAFSGDEFSKIIESFEKKSKILGMQDELRAFEAKPDVESIGSIQDKYSAYIKEDKDIQEEINKVTGFDSIKFKNLIAAQKGNLESKNKDQQIEALEEKVKDALLAFSGKEGDDWGKAEKSYKDALDILEEAAGGDEKYKDTIKEYNDAYDQVLETHNIQEKKKEFIAVQEELEKGEKDLKGLLQKWGEDIQNGVSAKDGLVKYHETLTKIENNFERYKNLKKDIDEDSKFDDKSFSDRLKEYSSVTAVVQGVESEVIIPTNPPKKNRDFP